MPGAWSNRQRSAPDEQEARTRPTQAGATAQQTATPTVCRDRPKHPNSAEQPNQNPKPHPQKTSHQQPNQHGAADQPTTTIPTAHPNRPKQKDSAKQPNQNPKPHPQKTSGQWPNQCGVGGQRTATRVACPKWREWSGGTGVGLWWIPVGLPRVWGGGSGVGVRRCAVRVCGLPRGRPPEARPGSGPRPAAGVESAGSTRPRPPPRRPGSVRAQRSNPWRGCGGRRPRSVRSLAMGTRPRRRPSRRPTAGFPTATTRPSAAGQGAAEWRRAALPYSCAPRFLAPGPSTCTRAVVLALNRSTPGQSVPGTHTRTNGPASGCMCNRRRSAVRARHSTGCPCQNGNQSTSTRHLPGTSPYPAVILSGRLRS